MPYREPADDDEARMDREEVLAFGRALQQRRWRIGAVVTLIGLGLVGTLVLTIAFFVSGHEKPPRPRCHTAWKIKVPNDGKSPAIREPIKVCDDDDADENDTDDENGTSRERTHY